MIGFQGYYCPHWKTMKGILNYADFMDLSVIVDSQS